MQNLPIATIYKEEIKYMPWGVLIGEVASFCIDSIPQKGTVIDLLCGAGSLLGMLKEKRSDVSYTGLDFEAEYIEHDKTQYSNIEFILADATKWESALKYDTVLCTAGLHHLSFDKQEAFIKKISELIKDDGFAIVADPYIDDFSNESEREIAGAKLGYEYLAETIRNGAPKNIVEAAITVLSNDVLGVEYKNSTKKIKPLFEKYFSSVEMHKTWPKEETEYGDYYFILKN